MKKIRTLDYFAPKFSLNTKKESKNYNTVLGGLLTILAVILFSAIAYVVGSDYLDTTKPVVSVNRIKMKAPERVDLFRNEVMGSFTIFTTRFFTKEETRRFMTTRVEIVTTDVDSNGNRVEKAQSYDSDILDRLKNPELVRIGTRGLIEASDEIDFYKRFGGVFIVPDITPSDFWIAGSKFNLPYRRLRIKVFPCSLPNPSDCASITELADAQFGNLVLSKVANYSDKANPKRFFADADTVIKFGLSSTVVANIYYKKI